MANGTTFDMGVAFVQLTSFFEDGIVPASHTKKGSRRYRYYISKKLVTGGCTGNDKQRSWRIPATLLEDTIVTAVAARLRNLASTVQDNWITRPEFSERDAATALRLVRHV